MKKLITIALLCAMLLSCFAGCAMQKGEIAVADATVQNVGDETAAPGILDALRTNVEKAKTNSFATNEVDTWDGTTVDTAWYDANATEKTYEITKASEYIGFRTLVNNGTKFTSWTVKLGKNIDLNEAEIAGTAKTFEGIFDGQNHVVCNFTLKISASDSGFFGNVVNTTVKNFGLVNVTSNIEATDAISSVGTFFGYINQGSTVQNLYTDAAISVKGGVEIDQIGGLIGRATSGSTKTLENCEFAGTINATAKDADNTYVGGIIGFWNKGTLTAINCVNNGIINTPSASAVGGILGAQSNAPGQATYTNCVNNGDITGAEYVGGLVGNVSATATKTSSKISNGRQVLTNCVNTGDIVGENYVAGFIGRCRLYGAKADCVYLETSAGLPAISVYLTNGISSGNITANNNVGGFIGAVHALNVELTDCEFSGNMNVTFNEEASVAGGLIADLYQDYALPDGADPKAILTNCKVTGIMNVDKYALNGEASLSVAKIGLPSEKVTVTELTTDKATLTDTLFTTMAGYQESAVVDGKYDLRLVAAFDEIEAVKAAGFVVTVNYKTADGKQVKFENKTVYANTVYTAVKGTDATLGEVTYAAEAYGADYLYTLVLENIPADYTVAAGTLEILVTPFTTDANAENVINGLQVQHGEIVIEEPAA